MSKLKKYLFSCLICSVFFFTLIPKTYADTINNGNFLIDANLYDTNLTFRQQVENAYYMNVPDNQFPVVYGFQINELNFSKSCNIQYGFRVDYTFWGWHNYENSINWVNYAKLISVYGTDFTTIGTIISEVNGYTLNFSTYFIWAPSYCPVDSVTGLNFRVNDNVRSPISNNFLYSSEQVGASRSYYVYNALYEHVDISVAQNLVNEYYTSGSISNEKLEAINGQLLDVNENLEQTNQKLDNLYQNINQTNNKIDSVNDNLNNVNTSIKDTQDYLKDDTAPSSDISVLGNVQGILPEGPIDSLLNIPFKVLSILSSSFGGVCVPISGKFVFDSTLTIPCFSELFYNNVPDSIMIFINVVPTAFILIAYLKNLYKRVDRALSLETSADDEWGGI